MNASRIKTVYNVSFCGHQVRVCYVEWAGGSCDHEYSIDKPVVNPDRDLTDMGFGNPDSALMCAYGEIIGVDLRLVE